LADLEQQKAERSWHPRCYDKNNNPLSTLLLSTLEYHVAAPQVLALYTLFYE